MSVKSSCLFFYNSSKVVTELIMELFKYLFHSILIGTTPPYVTILQGLKPRFNKVDGIY